MRVYLTIFVWGLLTLWPLQAAAQTTALTLSAGEHGSFSRIAIPAGGEGDWTSEQDGKTVRITLPGLTGPVNTSAIFPRRAAHRVLNVLVTQTAGATILSFKLACKCAARVYAWKGSKILIDIAGTAPVSPTPREPAQVAHMEPTPPAPQKFAPLDIEKTRANLRERLQAAVLAGVVQMDSITPKPAAAPAGPMDNMPAKEAPPSDMIDDQPNAGGETNTPASSSPAMGTESAAARPDKAGAPSMATSIMYGNQVNLDTQRSCLPDASLKLGSWLSADPFPRELARRRALLLGEFDTPNEKAALALVRFYLAYGLGEEAKLILGQFVSPDNAGVGLLADLIAIFRRTEVSTTGPILGAGQCPGAHGLWQSAALALNGNWQDAAKAEKRTGDALAQLPRNIRIPLGVHIAQAALNAGQMEQVRRILALLRRSGTIKSPALDLIEGKFALAENNQKRASSLLDPLSRSIHPQAVEATLVLSRAELVSPGFLSEDRLVDLSLIAMERRYTPLGREALILTAEAEAAAGRPEAALNILSREADASSLLTEKTQLRKEISNTLLRLYKPAAGETSLQETDLFWRYESYLGNDENTRAIRRSAARHLLTKGLPNAAISLLRKPGTEQGPPLMLAEALIATDQPEEVLKILEPFPDDPKALSLRSVALARLGQYADAARLIPDKTSEMGLLEQKAELLWSTGQWADAARIYTRLSGSAPPDDQAGFNRRIAAATYMAGDEGLTGETLSVIKLSDNKDLKELLTPTLKPSLPLPERVDQSLITAETVTRLLKELLADG